MTHLGERVVRPLAIAAALLVLSSAGAQEPEEKADLLHGTDGRFDMSGFLASRGGFMPVPIIITEPAVGYGGGLAAAFFHGGNPLAKERAAGERYVPPSVSIGGGFGTENGSKAAFAGHFGVWRADRIRYLGAVGAASFNLEYFGPPSRPLPEPLDYEVSGGIIFQRLLFRVSDSPLFLGAEWTWSTQQAEFVEEVLPPEAPPRDIDQDDSGAGVVAEYDTLDNLFTPNSGIKARLVGKIFSESIGGDNDRETLDLEGFGYIALHDRFNLGLRGDVALSDGDTPFYLLPYLKLRGLPALKYAGKHVALAEVEGRWDFDRRWSAVAFGGVGFVSESFDGLVDEETVGTYGAGFRYLLAERYGIRVGLDYGRGPEDDAVYIVVGNAWR